MSHPKTFLFHDYETWGVNPKQDFPCQFAAIRTDENFEAIGEPIDIMCQIPNDYLPNPGACLVTGITPQSSLQKGLLETEFAQKIFDVMTTPNTCSLGYNSMRFDDEVTRFLFYRNFLDPYAREWQNGNSRWDIIDLARACFALRPEGINWPVNDLGAPSFKLEALTQANNIEHTGAHDALVDVHATIALAKLLKTHQPKLFEYALSLRNKHTVLGLLNFDTLTPLIHISAKIPASQGCCTWILPITRHPTQSNAIICIDLSKDVQTLLNDTPEQIARKLYAPADELESSEQRPGIKLVHVNKSPFITSAKALSEQRAFQIGLDRETCLANYKKIVTHPECLSKLTEVYAQTKEFEPLPPQQRLYSDGFISNDEKQICVAIRASKPDSLSSLLPRIQPSTLRSLLFLYRGRNYPSTLSHEEMIDWQRHREQNLTQGGECLSISAFSREIDQLAQSNINQPKTLSILRALHEYVQNL